MPSKFQIDKIYLFIVVRVICVYDLSKVIEQACQAATFVSEATLRVTNQVVHFQMCDQSPLNYLSMVLQTTEVRLMGL